MYLMSIQVIFKCLEIVVFIIIALTCCDLITISFETYRPPDYANSCLGGGVWGDISVTKKETLRVMLLFSYKPKRVCISFVPLETSVVLINVITYIIVRKNLFNHHPYFKHFGPKRVISSSVVQPSLSPATTLIFLWLYNCVGKM